MKKLQKIAIKSEAEKRYKILEETLIIQARSAVVGEMLGIIAHQWRQPLSVMAMVTNKMNLQELSSPAPSQEMLSDIAVLERNISYLSNTIEDFKNFLKPEMEKEWSTDSKICEQFHTLAYPILKFHNIEQEIRLHDTTEFFIYGSELIQVLLSLVANAKDAICEQQNENGKIIILCEHLPDKEEYRFSFSDNGGGIPTNILETIFEPYISTKGAEGTGLGLYMAKIIIEEHFKGTIKAENIDDGACFTIQFPLTCKEKV